MPTKHSTKDRAWGTRYDTLDQSEPPSPPVQRLPTSEQKVQSPVSPLATFRSPPNEGEPATPATGPTGPDTIPHDASIFVGRYVARCICLDILTDSCGTAFQLISIIPTCPSAWPIIYPCTHRSRQSRLCGTAAAVFVPSFSARQVGAYMRLNHLLTPRQIESCVSRSIAPESTNAAAGAVLWSPPAV